MKDSVSDVAEGSLSATAADAQCSGEPLASVSGSCFAETVNTSSGNDSRLDGPIGSAASNGLNMDDIMEYLQCQDASLIDNSAQNVSSVNVSSSSSFMSDSNNPALSVSESLTPTTLSLATLQQLASECSTIDLSSLGMDSTVPFDGSDGPPSG